MCEKCDRPITPRQSMDIRNAIQNAGLYYEKAGLLTYEDLDDIELSLRPLITQENETIQPSGFYHCVGRVTFAAVSFMEGNNIVSVDGISIKRKGDVFNERVGQILALLDLYHNTLEEEEDQDDFSFRWV